MQNYNIDKGPDFPKGRICSWKELVVSLSNPILVILGAKVGILVLGIVGSGILISFKGKNPSELKVHCSWSKLCCSVTNTFRVWPYLLVPGFSCRGDKLPCVFWYGDDQADSEHWQW